MSDSTASAAASTSEGLFVREAPPVFKNGLGGPFLRAYINSIRSHLTGEGDLSETGKAIFVAPSLTRGVPVKSQAEFINSRVYALCDAMQDASSPMWSSEGAGSFSLFLKEYLDSVQDHSRPDHSKEKAALEKLDKAKLWFSLQLELATYRYRDFTANQGINVMSFDSWAETHGLDYLDAREERLTAKLEHQNLRSAATSDVKKAREVLASALDQLKYAVGTNMECAVDDITDSNFASNEAKAKNTVYRPLHLLEGLTWAGDRWASSGLTDRDTTTQIRIDLASGLDLPWSEFGFPELDNDKNDPVRRMTTVQKEAIAKVVEDWEMVLSYTGIHSFDVSRGLWNIDGFRAILPELVKDKAPENLRKQVFRTSRILLAYNADLVLRLPVETFQRLFQDPESEAPRSRGNSLESGILNALLTTFSFAKYAGNQSGPKRELHLKRERNELYTNMLGCLARKC